MFDRPSVCDDGDGGPSSCHVTCVVGGMVLVAWWYGFEFIVVVGFVGTVLRYCFNGVSTVGWCCWRRLRSCQLDALLL